MPKTLMTAVTPHGTFTRATASKYTHVVVRSSPRALAAYQRALAGEPCYKDGVDGRWIRDCGHVVSWHSSEGAAHKAAAGGYFYDRATCVLGIYAISA